MNFHREWEFRIPGKEDVRKIAEFILEEDLKTKYANNTACNVSGPAFEHISVLA